MGNDEDFEGLRSKKKVGEEAVPLVPTSQNVILEEFLIPDKHARMGGWGRVRIGSIDRATRGRGP